MKILVKGDMVVSFETEVNIDANCLNEREVAEIVTRELKERSAHGVTITSMPIFEDWSCTRIKEG